MHTIRVTTLLAVALGLSWFGNASRAQEQQRLVPAQQAPQQPAAATESTTASRDLETVSNSTTQGRNRRPFERSSRQQPPPILPEEFVPSRLASRAMAVMGLLIVACVGAMWYGQRHSKKGRMGSSSTDLQVLDTLSIAPRCCVHLLRVGGQKYLVARDQAGIKSVTAVSAFAATLDDLADNRADAAQDATAPSLTNRSWATRSDQWSSTLNR